jgi:transposase
VAAKHTRAGELLKQTNSVVPYRKGMHHTLSRLTTHVIAPRDVRDDRLSPLLQHVRQPASWHRIAYDWNPRSIEGYPLPQDMSRCDTTTVSGTHEVTEEGLRQCGHSTDDPTRPPITVIRGSLDPLGMPLTTDAVSGHEPMMASTSRSSSVSGLA